MPTCPSATKHTKAKFPFDIVGAVIMPDHIHFIWQLPDNDSDYPKRVNRMKVLFTQSILNQSIRNRNTRPIDIALSHRKEREINVWHRRYYEQPVRWAPPIPDLTFLENLPVPTLPTKSSDTSKLKHITAQTHLKPTGDRTKPQQGDRA